MVAVYMLILGGSRASYRNHAPRTCCASSPQTRCAPSPLVGEGWRGGDAVRHRRCLTQPPPPLTPPHKGEGNAPRSRRPATTSHDLNSHYPCGRAIWASAKILYCCTRGLAASAASTNCSELLPRSARGRIITRMKRLGRSAACANTGSGPLSYHAPPGP